MNCRDYEHRMIAHVLGELAEDVASGCRAHIETCARCRAVYESYACLVGAIITEPETCPTASESAALAEALANVELCPRVERRMVESVPQGFPGFVLASVLAFLVIVTGLGLQRFGVIDVLAAVRGVGLQWVALAAVVVVFVTSFIPIAVTAKRRPLNGMTFRG